MTEQRDEREHPPTRRTVDVIAPLLLLTPEEITASVEALRAKITGEKP